MTVLRGTVSVPLRRGTLKSAPRLRYRWAEYAYAYAYAYANGALVDVRPYVPDGEEVLAGSYDEHALGEGGGG